MTPFLPILGQLFQGFFSRIWLIIGWQVCILGLLFAKCSYLLKPCFNYTFQVSILSISRKVMEGNDKLKSSTWKFLRRNKKSQIWDQKCLIWVFLGKNFKKLLWYLKSASSNLSKVIFGIGSAFSKVPGPGPGPLYELWRKLTLACFCNFWILQRPELRLTCSNTSHKFFWKDQYGRALVCVWFLKAFSLHFNSRYT